MRVFPRFKNALFAAWHRRRSPRSKPIRDLRGQEPGKLLVIQVQHLGDSLVATPLLRALKAGYPNTVIDVLVNRTSFGVHERNPDLQELIQLRQWERGPLARWMEIFFLGSRLRSRGYDWALCDATEVAFSHGLLAWMSRIPVRLGLDWRQRGFLFTHTIPFPEGDASESMVSMNLRLTDALGIPRPAPSLIFPVKEEERSEVMNRLKRAAASKNRPLVALHPGSHWPSNLWSTDRFEAVADWLIEAHQATVVFVGAPHELSRFRGLFASRPAALNWGGETTLGELAALFEASDLVLTLDSGPSHLAAAVKATTLVLRSAQQPRGRWEHRQPRCESLVRVIHCSPCESPCCPNRRHPMECMDLISVEDVKAAVTRLLCRRI